MTRVKSFLAFFGRDNLTESINDFCRQVEEKGGEIKDIKIVTDSSEHNPRIQAFVVYKLNNGDDINA